MYEIYTVQSGDTIASIANQYDTTEGVLYQINGWDKDYVLKPRNQIIVPVLKKQPYEYYTVKKGENPYQIAKDHDLNYTMLLQLNGLEENDYIYPNQTLILPKKGLNVYLTKNDDTFRSVLKTLGLTVEELLGENDQIYLRPEQIIIFKKK